MMRARSVYLVVCCMLKAMRAVWKADVTFLIYIP